MDAVQYIAPARFVYLQIPAAELRSFADGLFPGLAHDSIADAVSGGLHRFKHGHDLLIDVLGTLKTHGIGRAAHQAGHILLTDSVTKAGIPFPGFSAKGLGGWLHETLGVSRAWFNISAFDAGIGIFAVAESATDIIQAANGALLMDSIWSFVDTFGEGFVELAWGYSSCNPLLVAAGGENILAGVLATVNSGRKILEQTFLIADPFDFFGAGLASALVGFALAGVVTGGNMAAAVEASLKSGLIGSLCSISLLAGFGASLGFAAYAYGKALGQRDVHTPISDISLRIFMDEITQQFPEIQKLLDLADKNILKSMQYTPLMSNKQVLENENTFQLAIMNTGALSPTDVVLAAEKFRLNVEG